MSNPFSAASVKMTASGRCVPEPSYPPLAEALAMLEDRIQNLHSRLEAISTRLTPVLAPSAPSMPASGPANTKDMQIHSEVVLQIRGKADAIDNAIVIVESLLRRCDV